MAKQVSLGNLGGSQTVSAGGKSTPSIDSLLPPAMAYVVNSTDISSLLTDSDAETKFLIGLRIEFREGSNLLAKPRIRKVYFDEAASDQDSFFLVSPDTMELTAHVYGRPVIKTSDEKFQLDSAAIIPVWVDGHKPYKKLRFYKDIDFVFFPAGPLQLLTEFYDKLIISGYRFEVGGKLNLEPDVSATSGEDDEICFSLKIEGYERTSKSTPAQKVDATAGSYIDAVGTDVLFGHPCPPMWQQFLGVAAAIIARKGTGFDISKMTAIRASWLNPKNWQTIPLPTNK
ncbi:MAG: hypothetical protein KF852_06160 [Saprospiraceae bacterium]|nr:hypothetical protein [Saprospiraceae bacterium]